MRGGVGAYTAALASALQKQHVQVSVLTRRASGRFPGPTPDTLIDQTEHLSEKGSTSVTVYRVIERWGPHIFWAVPNYANTIKADWIHVQYQTAAFGMNPAINFGPDCWQSRGMENIAWTYHDLLVPYLFPKIGDRMRRWVTEKPAKTSKLTIVTNEGDHAELRKRGIAAVKIPIGSNVRGVELSCQERMARRKLRGYEGNDLVIAYFGFLNRSKGGITLIHTLFRLQKERQHVFLLMIGEKIGASDPSNREYLFEVDRLIAELGLTDRVQWTGHQSDEDVGADLNACDVLFMPYEDGASLRRGTLMAGLANGCAIVTTQPKQPIPELVDGEHLMYVPPRSPDSAARIIAYLADSGSVTAQLRRNAREISLRFSWGSIATQHRDAYSFKLENS